VLRDKIVISHALYSSDYQVRLSGSRAVVVRTADDAVVAYGSYDIGDETIEGRSVRNEIIPSAEAQTIINAISGIRGRIAVPGKRFTVAGTVRVGNNALLYGNNIYCVSGSIAKRTILEPDSELTLLSDGRIYYEVDGEPKDTSGFYPKTTGAAKKTMPGHLFLRTIRTYRDAVDVFVRLNGITLVRQSDGVALSFDTKEAAPFVNGYVVRVKTDVYVSLAHIVGLLTDRALLAKGIVSGSMTSVRKDHLAAAVWDECVFLLNESTDTLTVFNKKEGSRAKIGHGVSVNFECDDGNEYFASANGSRAPDLSVCRLLVYSERNGRYADPFAITGYIDESAAGSLLDRVDRKRFANAGIEGMAHHLSVGKYGSEDRAVTPPVAQIDWSQTTSVEAGHNKDENMQGYNLNQSVNAVPAVVMNTGAAGVGMNAAEVKTMDKNTKTSTIKDEAIFAAELSAAGVALDMARERLLRLTEGMKAPLPAKILVQQLLASPAGPAAIGFLIRFTVPHLIDRLPEDSRPLARRATEAIGTRSWQFVFEGAGGRVIEEIQSLLKDYAKAAKELGAPAIRVDFSKVEDAVSVK